MIRYTQNKLVCENTLTNLLILSKDEVYIDRSGNVYIDRSGNVYIDRSGNVYIDRSGNVYIDRSGNVYIDQSGNVYIDRSGNTKLVLKVLKYQDNYRPEHLSSEYVKTFIVFIMKT
jgi:hypothetical protein